MKANSGGISVGDMRTSAQFQSNAPVANASGGTADNYTTFYTCRGRLRQQSGSRKDEQTELVRNRNFEFVCRFCLAIKNGVDTNTRVLIGSDTYVIVNFELVDQLNHWYQFILSKNG